MLRLSLVRCGVAMAIAFGGFVCGAIAFGEPAPSGAELITAADAAEDDLLVVVPGAMDMGFVTIGDERHRRVWVINPSETDELRIKAVRFDCGCTTAPGFQLMTLEPGEARAIDLEIHAPIEVGKQRDVRVFYVLENGDAVFSTVHFETVDTCSGFSIDPPVSEDDVLALPGEMDLGDLPLEERTEFTMWFVNQSDTPRQIEKLKTSCGCLSASGFEPSVIEPGHAVRVDLTLRQELEPLDERRVRLVAMDAVGVMAETTIVYSVGTKQADDGWETVPVTPEQ
ncbi:MAG: DUF1573 domain-containing protein [Phycisphaerales bacterium]|nr:DUF1573 domain-containing protein [Phycisphaerales bacterium]